MILHVHTWICKHTSACFTRASILCVLTQLLLLAQTTHIWDKQPGDGQAGGDLERHAAVQHNGFICVGPQVLHWEHRQAHELTSAHALPEGDGAAVLAAGMGRCTLG